MKIKICGVTEIEDAKKIVELGVEYLGVVLAPHSKRFVDLEKAIQIRKSVLNSNTEFVAVFDKEEVTKVLFIAEKLNTDIVQLHGVYSAHELKIISSKLLVFYAVPQRVLLTELPEGVIPLYDANQPGSGLTFKWDEFKPPASEWILAGGLNIDNIEDAIRLLHPAVVDVASGVELTGFVRKNHELLTRFVNKVRNVLNDDANI